MKKLHSVLLKFVSSLVLFSACMVIFSLNVGATGLNNKTWNYKTEKAHVSSWDKYSSSAASFKNTEWKLLNENQLREISTSKTKVNINLDCGQPASGDVLFGMKTDNISLAFWAFKNMTFNGKTNYYADLEKITNYSGTGTSIIVVRIDPSRSTTVTSEFYLNEETKTPSVGMVYTITNPKQDLVISVKDTGCTDMAKVSYKYSYKQRKSTPNTYDIVLEVTVAKTITEAPKISNGDGRYFSELQVTVSEYIFTKKYTDKMQLRYYYFSTIPQAKQNYPKMNGCSLLEYHFNGKFTDVSTFVY